MSAAMPAASLPPVTVVRQDAHWTDRIAHIALAVVALALVAFLALPLAAILREALQGKEGEFVWFDNFLSYAKTPALLESLWNSVWVSLLVTFITLPLAFGFAYALTRSCMPFKPLFRGITLVPLLAPSLLAAISLIYWFGNQGVLKSWMQAVGISEIYGAPGIVVAECFAVFPHALMILVTALSLSDARLYEAAEQHSNLLDMLERRLPLTHEVADRVTLRLKMAGHHLGSTGAPALPELARCALLAPHRCPAAAGSRRDARECPG